MKASIQKAFALKNKTAALGFSAAVDRCDDQLT
jgi:hypothetical protein